MKFEKEVWARYSQVHSLAKKNARKAERNGMERFPKFLKNELNGMNAENTVDLGTIAIPVNRIIGTATFEEGDLYSPDFLPLASMNSPYANDWCQLYMEYLTDKGWDSPIRCIEYLGNFYVLDGKKRVSVLNAHGAYETEAIVTRIMPENTESEDVQSYLEFLKDYEKTGLYQVRFTQPGCFAKLQAALGNDEEYVWNESDRFSFLFTLLPVETALRSAYHGYLNVTAADALLMLLEEYSYLEVRKMQPWDLTKVLANSWVKLYKIMDPDFEVAPVGATRKAS